MRRIAKILLYLIIILPSIKHIAQDEPDEVGNFYYDGHNREYEVYLPQNFTSNMPLVISIHGYTENIAWYKGYTKMHETADTMGYVIVYPQGIINSWNAGVADIRDSYPNTNDVGFISALIDTMKTHHDIDLSRVYCCGFSLGGMMSIRLIGDIGYRFAAAASVSGPLFDLANTWEIVRPIPILQMHGDSDGLVPFKGDAYYWGITKTIDYWLNKNNCSMIADTFNFPDIEPSDNCTIQKINYTNCSGESQVVHYKGIGMGHSWPSSTFTFGSEGNKNMDINANVEILNFFNNYQNPLVNLAYTKSLKFSIPKFLNTDDTLKVVVKLANPDQHPVNVLAYIESELSVQRDSLLLYDNGLQGDVVAFDNLFTVHQKMSDFGKDYYTLSLGAKDLTEDVTTNYRLHWNFTNIGPIIMGDKPYSYTDRDPDHYLSLAIKNVDTQIIDGIVVNLSTEDDRVSLVEVNDVSFGNIEPGTEVSGKNHFIFYYSGDYNSDSTKNKPILFNVKIFRNGTHYWSDSFKFSTDETCPEPPTNLKAEVDSTNSTVNLSWSPCNADDLDKYNIYRSTIDNVDSAKYLISVLGVDTNFTDSNPSGIINYYWVTAIDFAGNESIFSDRTIVGVDDLHESIPNYYLTQNYPNPFNPITTIKYSIPQKSYVSLKVFDVLGSEVSTLVKKELPQGNYEIEFDGKELTSGIYFYRLRAGEFVNTRKMILIK